MDRVPLYKEESGFWWRKIWYILGAKGWKAYNFLDLGEQLFVNSDISPIYVGNNDSSLKIQVTNRNITGKEKSMELTRVDYVILKFLKKKNCINYFESATLQEIMQITSNSRPTTYRKMMNLKKYGYVEKGCKSVNADTFYLLEKGIKIVENGGMDND